MLISESYRKLNRDLHESNPKYGTSGKHDRHVAMMKALIDDENTRDVLDYGCGKRTLQDALGLSIANYDPAIPGFDCAPEPHDLLACTDVLEHIEPDCLDDVLKDIRRCTKKAAYLVIGTRPAKKILSDGRNAHLIQEGFDWWRERIEAVGFEILGVIDYGLVGEFSVVCK